MLSLAFVLPVLWGSWASSCLQWSVHFIGVKGVWQQVSSFKLPAAVGPVVDYLHASWLKRHNLGKKRRAHLSWPWVTRSLSQWPSLRAGRKQALLNCSTQRCRGIGLPSSRIAPLCGPSGGTSIITTEINFSGNKSTKWKMFLSSVNTCRCVHTRPLLRGHGLKFNSCLKFSHNCSGKLSWSTRPPWPP